MAVMLFLFTAGKEDSFLDKKLRCLFLEPRLAESV